MQRYDVWKNKNGSVTIESHPLGDFVQADEAIKMLAVIRDLMAEKSGAEKSCGHHFDCVCAAKAARAILDRVG